MWRLGGRIPETPTSPEEYFFYNETDLRDGKAIIGSALVPVTWFQTNKAVA